MSTCPGELDAHFAALAAAHEPFAAGEPAEGDGTARRARERRGQPASVLTEPVEAARGRGRGGRRVAVAVSALLLLAGVCSLVVLAVIRERPNRVSDGHVVRAPGVVGRLADPPASPERAAVEATPRPKSDGARGGKRRAPRRGATAPPRRRGGTARRRRKSATPRARRGPVTASPKAAPGATGAPSTPAPSASPSARRPVSPVSPTAAPVCAEFPPC